MSTKARSSRSYSKTVLTIQPRGYVLPSPQQYTWLSHVPRTLPDNAPRNQGLFSIVKNVKARSLFTCNSSAETQYSAGRDYRGSRKMPSMEFFEIPFVSVDRPQIEAHNTWFGSGSRNHGTKINRTWGKWISATDCHHWPCPGYRASVGAQPVLPR